MRKLIIRTLLITAVSHQTAFAGNILQDERPLLSGPECEAIKKQKVIGSATYVVSSHKGGQGLIYSSEPFWLYQDGCLVQQGLTNKRGEVIFDYTEEATYVLALVTWATIIEPHKILRKGKK